MSRVPGTCRRAQSEQPRTRPGAWMIRHPTTAVGTHARTGDHSFRAAGSSPGNGGALALAWEMSAH
jgi:hypothetical protein